MKVKDTENPEWRAIYEKRLCRRGLYRPTLITHGSGDYKERFEKGTDSALGSGFDPGDQRIFQPTHLKHYFDEIHYIDILDCNGGDHGYPFATNFNPEINLRGVSAPGSYWENGKWVKLKPMSIKREYDFTEVGQKTCIFSTMKKSNPLAKNIPGVKRIRFFMTQSILFDSYEMLGKCWSLRTIQSTLMDKK